MKRWEVSVDICCLLSGKIVNDIYSYHLGRLGLYIHCFIVYIFISHDGSIGLVYIYIHEWVHF